MNLQEALDFLDWCEKKCKEDLKKLNKNIAKYGKVRRVNGVVYITKPEDK